MVGYSRALANVCLDRALVLEAWGRHLFEKQNVTINLILNRPYVADNRSGAGERFRNTWPIVTSFLHIISNIMFRSFFRRANTASGRSPAHTFVTEVAGQAPSTIDAKRPLHLAICEPEP